MRVQISDGTRQIECEAKIGADGSVTIDDQAVTLDRLAGAVVIGITGGERALLTAAGARLESIGGGWRLLLDKARP